MNNNKIKISIVNYTNTIPFKWALKRSALLSKIDLQEDIPSICAQKLKFKQVQLALVPVAILTELDQYFIESDYCIGTLGEVESVKLYSNVPLTEIKSITLDYQSRTSIMLTKILCKNFWKITPEFKDSKPGFEKLLEKNTANVVIGDRTFDLNGKFKYEFDLGLEWKKLSGLPFVFAAWVSTEKMDENFIAEFNSILKHGLVNCKQAIEDSANQLIISNEKAYNYLTEKISYNLDQEKKEALNLFLNYVTKLNE